MRIARSHPRFRSLQTRSLLEKGVENGIVSLNGLIAHGRGEAFDYLLSEKTHGFAKQATHAASAMLLLATHPVISVNGNTAALAARELVQLAILLNAPLEINLFHPSRERVRKIKNLLEKAGAKNILLPDKKYAISHIHSSRKFVNKDGIYKADVVFVPLEDGDRTEALVKNGKKVITVDLNPLSRTSKAATVTIVDNIVRVMPLLLAATKKLHDVQEKKLHGFVHRYNKILILEKAEALLRKGR